jgi:hypothetical protein
MPVQDDERERELVRMFNLNWDPAHQRAGVDALLDLEVGGRRYRFECEVKSTTGNTVATARDVGMAHIQRWRRMLFIIGFYSREARRPELLRCLCLTPVDLEPWIASIESKVLIDFRIAALASRHLTMDDLFDVCGNQTAYTVADAKRLHKQQWSALQYEEAIDMEVDGLPRISPRKMLEVLRLRAKYIAERGATLNNPHITSTQLSAFFGTSREITGNAWATGIRNVAEMFVNEHPGHIAAMLQPDDVPPAPIP